MLTLCSMNSVFFLSRWHNFMNNTVEIQWSLWDLRSPQTVSPKNFPFPPSIPPSFYHRQSSLQLPEFSVISPFRPLAPPSLCQTFPFPLQPLSYLPLHVSEETQEPPKATV